MAAKKGTKKTAKKPATAGESSGSLVILDSLQDSQFWARLQSFKTPDAEQLRLDVGRVAEAAQAMADQVVRFLPQFTDHARRHLFNVLSYMEHLAGPKNIAQMEPLECALGILAALTHDLGMALAGEELEVLDKSDADFSSSSQDSAAIAWRNFRDSHALMDRARLAKTKAETEKRSLTAEEGRWIDALLGQIRADYIRQSHADDRVASGYNRIHEWLQKIGQSEEIHRKYRGFDFWEPLSWLGMSHGQSIHWLEERLERGKNGFSVPRAQLRHHHFIANEAVDWLFLSWLLRLADIMDFDASRTPVVLFDHAGITDSKSRIEWLKHRSLPSPPVFGQDPDGQTLLYVCPECPSPEVEKAISQTLSWVDEELGKVTQAQSQSRSERLILSLPSGTHLKVTTRAGGYLYRDVEFRLNRDAVMELLMGEALYGEPTLALRELVQNALDALHLRDLRNQLLGKLAAEGKGADELPQPVDPLLTHEKLEVNVTWGTRTEPGAHHGRRFIRVRDNGVGMTLDSIQKFLTQIGRSYYKSDVYRREAELMRRHGLICTTISQFGIGFLSSFMLADHVTVKTRACGANMTDKPLPDEPEEHAARRRFPVRAEINGTHGLIALYPDDSIKTCGTEITLWLKEEFDFAEWDRELVLGKLRFAFYGQGEHHTYRHEFVIIELDPAFEIASQIGWPLYPVKLAADADSWAYLNVDDQFHPRELIPIQKEQFVSKFEEWSITGSAKINMPTWHCCDWTHETSGSRIRLQICRLGAQAKPADASEWDSMSDVEADGLTQIQRNTFIESLLPREGRVQLFVNGVKVSDLDGLFNDDLRLGPGIGTILWVDLRGPVAPRLKADRMGITQIQPAIQKMLFQKLQADWVEKWTALAHSLQWVRHGIRWDRDWFQSPITGSNRKVKFILFPELPLYQHWLSRSLDQEIAFDQSRGSPVNQNRSRDYDLNINFHIDNIHGRLNERVRSEAFDLNLNHALDFSRILDRALSLARGLDYGLSDDLFRLISLALSRARDDALEFDGHHIRFRDSFSEQVRDSFRTQRDAITYSTLPNEFSSFLRLHWVNEALQPSLGDAFPAVAIPDVIDQAGHWFLAAPLKLTMEAPVDPMWINAYELCSPLTVSACQALRAACPAWADQRWMRALFLLPFLFGKEIWGKVEELENLLGVDSLLLFMPNPDLWSHDFNDLAEEEWAVGSSSAWWDIGTGRVLYAHGIHTKESIAREGLPLLEWLDAFEKSAGNPKSSAP